MIDDALRGWVDDDAGGRGGEQMVDTKEPLYSEVVDAVVSAARLLVQYNPPTTLECNCPCHTSLASQLLARRLHITKKAKLSAREREVLDLILAGQTHEGIGLSLGIKSRTSKWHFANVLAKLGADSRDDLFRIFL
jgi:DNA-binding CsgD family transcriptional regulator